LTPLLIQEYKALIMTKQSEAFEARREFLIRALQAGAYALTGSLLMPGLARAGALGKVPRPMPEGRSIYDLRGEVLVNGKPATMQTVIGHSDRIETAKNAQLIFVVGKDAFVMREGSKLELSGDGSLLVSGLRLVSGALLSVFGKKQHHFSTPVATIGIRGTGLYVETQDDMSYVCTCYGTTDIAALNDPSSQETIVSQHHDAPRYILADGSSGQRIRSAPFKNHTDVELALIEALVGRTPPFNLFDEGYGSPRRY
jgi:hypothetical protein